MLKSAAALERAPGVPGLDRPGLEIVSIARDYGCHAAQVEDLGPLRRRRPDGVDQAGPDPAGSPDVPQVPPLI